METEGNQIPQKCITFFCVTENGERIRYKKLILINFIPLKPSYRVGVKNWKALSETWPFTLERVVASLYTILLMNINFLLHGENFMAIFTTLSMVICFSMGILGIFATLVYVFTMRVVI